MKILNKNFQKIMTFHLYIDIFQSQHSGIANQLFSHFFDTSVENNYPTHPQKREKDQNSTQNGQYDKP